MKRYIVRVWVDLEVLAETREEAISIANNHRIDVDETVSAELYDCQISGDVWEK